MTRIDERYKREIQRITRIINVKKSTLRHVSLTFAEHDRLRSKQNSRDRIITQLYFCLRFVMKPVQARVLLPQSLGRPLHLSRHSKVTLIASIHHLKYWTSVHCVPQLRGKHKELSKGVFLKPHLRGFSWEVAASGPHSGTQLSPSQGIYPNLPVPQGTLGNVSRHLGCSRRGGAAGICG